MAGRGGAFEPAIDGLCLRLYLSAHSPNAPASKHPPVHLPQRAYLAPTSTYLAPTSPLPRPYLVLSGTRQPCSLHVVKACKGEAAQLCCLLQCGHRGAVYPSPTQPLTWSHLV